MKQHSNKSKSNINILNYIPKKYGDSVFDATIKYQKKYGFQIGSGNSATHNNEADAFKHAYMQAQLTLWTGNNIAKTFGDFHEFQGNQTMGQSKEEYNMDSWNNNQGREIAKEIVQEYGPGSIIPSQKINDIIAQKIVQRMKEGKLITNLNDKRQYQEYHNELPFIPTRGVGGVQKNGIPSGFASNIDTNQLMQELEQSVNNQTNQSQQPQSIISGYTNPLTGNNRIFTREEVDAMTEEEFEKNEKEIMAQVDAMKGKMPTNRDMQREVNSGAAVYVNPYTRSDGTNVKGYYRSKPAN